MKKTSPNTSHPKKKTILSFFPSMGEMPSIAIGNKGGLFFLALLFPLITFPQTWQWGVSGGTTADQNNGDAFEEPIVDMDTDQQGNVYIAVNVGGQDITIQGNTLTFHGQDEDKSSGLIASYDCNGNYRWGKLVNGTNSFVQSIRTDTLGNVYVVGEVFPETYDPFTGITYTAHFGNDTIFPPSTALDEYNERLFLLRYDTLGNFEQLIMPELDSTTYKNTFYAKYYSKDMVVDPGGLQHWFMSLKKGTNPSTGEIYYPVIEGDTLPDGEYVLKYDHLGNYLGNVNLEMDLKELPLYTDLRINHDPVSGSYYMTGYNNTVTTSQTSLSIGGQLVSSTMFVAKFDSLGQSEWLIQGGGSLSINNLFNDRPQIGNQGNIYLAGTMHHFNNPQATFNGYTAQNSIAPETFPVIIKMDSNGNLIWGSDADTPGGLSILNSYAILNGETIEYTNIHEGITWGNISYAGVLNSGIGVFLARLDKQTGNIISLDTLGSDYGYNEYPTAIAAGPRRNVYVGGEFQSKMYVGGSTLQNQNVPPDGTDYFVAKFGQNNCNCTLPQAKFSFSGTGNGTVNYTYTGTSPYDELEWGFGNRQTSTTTTGTISHAYTTDKEFWVCVTAYNSCGYDTWCTMLEPFQLGIPALSKENFSFYPNPTQGLLNIKTQISFSYRLFSLSGQKLRSGELEKGGNVLDFSRLSPGFYMLVVENEKGQTRTVKVVRE